LTVKAKELLWTKNQMNYPICVTRTELGYTSGRYLNRHLTEVKRYPLKYIV